MMASATLYEVAFGFAAHMEFLCREHLCQAIEKHQKDGHAHDDHVVADAVGDHTGHGQKEQTRQNRKIPLDYVLK